MLTADWMQREKKDWLNVVRKKKVSIKQKYEVYFGTVPKLEKLKI